MDATALAAVLAGWNGSRPDLDARILKAGIEGPVVEALRAACSKRKPDGTLASPDWYAGAALYLLRDVAPSRVRAIVRGYVATGGWVSGPEATRSEKDRIRAMLKTGADEDAVVAAIEAS